MPDPANPYTPWSSSVTVVRGTAGNDVALVDKVGDNLYSISVNGEIGYVTGEQLKQIKFDLGEGDDVFIASEAVDVGLWVYGGAGADFIQGGSGNDALRGGDGDDEIYGGAGRDVLWAGGGNDSLYGEAGDDQLGGLYGHNVLDGGDGRDRILIGRHDTVVLPEDRPDSLVEASQTTLAVAAADEQAVQAITQAQGQGVTQVLAGGAVVVETIATPPPRRTPTLPDAQGLEPPQDPKPPHEPDTVQRGSWLDWYRSGRRSGPYDGWSWGRAASIEDHCETPETRRSKKDSPSASSREGIWQAQTGDDHRTVLLSFTSLLQPLFGVTLVFRYDLAGGRCLSVEALGPKSLGVEAARAIQQVVLEGSCDCVNPLFSAALPCEGDHGTPWLPPDEATSAKNAFGQWGQNAGWIANTVIVETLALLERFADAADDLPYTLNAELQGRIERLYQLHQALSAALDTVMRLDHSRGAIARDQS
jgi:hypothetical protein